MRTELLHATNSMCWKVQQVWTIDSLGHMCTLLYSWPLRNWKYKCEDMGITANCVTISGLVDRRPLSSGKGKQTKELWIVR